jgi:hypothetical protein
MTDPTDQVAPGETGTISAEAPEPAPTPPAAKPGSRKAGLIAIAILVVPLALILWAVKDNQAAADLKAGDCFNLPTATTFQTVETRPCAEAHTGEVFHTAEYDGRELTVPISFALSGFVETSCGPAFQAYVGKSIDESPDLTIGYLYPTGDAWSDGDRTITCYIARADEGTMTGSLKAS